jgi:hypothetical protein
MQVWWQADLIGIEFVGEIMSRQHLFWNAGVLAASETGGAARLNVRQVVDGVFEDFLSSVLCLLSSDSPADGVPASRNGCSPDSRSLL